MATYTTIVNAFDNGDPYRAFEMLKGCDNPTEFVSWMTNQAFKGELAATKQIWILNFIARAALS